MYDALHTNDRASDTAAYTPTIIIIIPGEDSAHSDDNTRRNTINLYSYVCMRTMRCDMPTKLQTPDSTSATKESMQRETDLTKKESKRQRGGCGKGNVCDVRFACMHKTHALIECSTIIIIIIMIISIDLNSDHDVIELIASDERSAVTPCICVREKKKLARAIVRFCTNFLVHLYTYMCVCVFSSRMSEQVQV